MGIKINEVKKHFNEFDKNKLEVSRYNRFFSFLKIRDFYPFFKLPLMNIFLRVKLNKRLGKDKVPAVFNKLLSNEGGLYKMKVYSHCNKIKNIKNRKVLVEGCGFGRNIIQLIDFKPKEIIAFDLYKYPKEWAFLREYANKKGVNLVFIEDDLSKLNKKYKGYFNFIFSDAVLEHIKNLDSFLFDSHNLLKKGGIFYASFGPIWFGPGGIMFFGVKIEFMIICCCPKKNILKI
jgi:2-polyprenyl-3-methyl-5-hydroxy-6-metoxy-1,4-benzoquinol methylase